MKLKHVSLMLLLALLVLFALGCTNEIQDDNVTQNKVSYDNSIVAQNSKQFSVDSIDKNLFYPFSTWGAMSISIDYDTLREKYEFDVIRYSNGKYYTLMRLSDGSTFFMLFYETSLNAEGSNLILIDGFRVEKLLNKEAFESIGIGSSRDSVIQLDPLSFSEDLYSIHRFSDKSVIMIKYQIDLDDNAIVSEIIELDTENSVLSYLLPQDYELIT